MIASATLGQAGRAAIVGLLLVAPPALAAGPQQAPAASSPAAAAATPSPYQIFVMEAVLQRAVDHGALLLSRRIHSVAPNLIVLAGMSRARGFRLPGYGVFFDVEVPALRRSIAWSFQMLDRPDPTLADALEQLRQHVQSVDDRAMRQSLEEALKEIEAEVGPVAPALAGGASGPSVTAATTAASTMPAPGAPKAADSDRDALLQDPEGAYRQAVQEALIDAMLDYGGPLSLQPDQWLVVAARDDQEGAQMPGDPPESHALTLRIRGRDLQAFHAGQISRAEAVKRIEVDQE